jgi:ribosomal protein S18 acetylase RimI-like enzyme
MNEADFELVIRPFEASDQAVVRRLILEGLGEHFGFIDETLNPDIDDITANYIIAGHVFVVVQDGNDIVGTGALVFRGEGIGQMVRVSVRSDYRRKGIGKAIVEHLIEVARQRGVRRLIVETNSDWYDAIGLYKRLGFVEYRRSDIGVCMVLDLSQLPG